MRLPSLLLAAALCWSASPASFADLLAVRGETVYTSAGEPLAPGVVLIEGGTITAVGLASEIEIPEGAPVLEAAVVTPGLIDARSTVGFSGFLNQSHDQDQLERSSPIQPELRAIDAYNARERLIEWVRGFGVTTLHTGHGPGAVISGQTLIVKTRGETVGDAVMVESAMVAATLGESAQQGDGGPSSWPGTRAKAAALLRAELLEAQHYAA
ncbi:MAG: amidohydrolase, partial [Acidobacteriota bacterium]